jgi:hypothetical protein
MTALIFSTLVLSMIIIIIDGLSSDAVPNLYNINIINDVGDARVELLQAKRRESDGPTILAYVVILAAIIIPNVPQID